MKKESNQTLTDLFCQIVREGKSGNIPNDVYDQSKICFLDWLSCVVAGNEEPIVKKMKRYAQTIGGNKQASILMTGEKTSVLNATIVNAAAAHIMGNDDTSTIYIGHSSASLMPGLLSLSEWQDKSGLDFLRAHIIAFKIASILGEITGLTPYQKGFWTTTTVGGIAAAAGCSYLLDLDELQTSYALGIAAGTASGLKSVFGSEAKAYHIGHMASSAISAAILGKEQVTCSEMLENIDGYLQVYKGSINIDGVEKYLNGYDEFDHLAQKYHASCHFTHSAIEAIERISTKNTLKISDIDAIEIQASDLGVKAAGKTVINTILDAKFSAIYCVANKLLRGKTGIDVFTEENIKDPAILSFMKKITLKTNIALKPMESKVTVTLSNGNRLSETVDVFSEIPTLDIKREKIIQKFYANCKKAFPEEKISRLVEMIMNLQKVDTMRLVAEELKSR